MKPFIKAINQLNINTGVNSDFALFNRINKPTNINLEKITSKNYIEDRNKFFHEYIEDNSPSSPLVTKFSSNDFVNENVHEINRINNSPNIIELEISPTIDKSYRAKCSKYSATPNNHFNKNLYLRKKIKSSSETNTYNDKTISPDLYSYNNTNNHTTNHTNVHTNESPFVNSLITSNDKENRNKDAGSNIIPYSDGIIDINSYAGDKIIENETNKTMKKDRKSSAIAKKRNGSKKLRRTSAPAPRFFNNSNNIDNKKKLISIFNNDHCDYESHRPISVFNYNVNESDESDCEFNQYFNKQRHNYIEINNNCDNIIYKNININRNCENTNNFNNNINAINKKTSNSNVVKGFKRESLQFQFNDLSKQPPSPDIMERKTQSFKFPAGQNYTSRNQQNNSQCAQSNNNKIKSRSAPESRTCSRKNQNNNTKNFFQFRTTTKQMPHQQIIRKKSKEVNSKYIDSFSPKSSDTFCCVCLYKNIINHSANNNNNINNSFNNNLISNLNSRQNSKANKQLNIITSTNGNFASPCICGRCVGQPRCFVCSQCFSGELLEDPAERKLQLVKIMQQMDCQVVKNFSTSAKGGVINRGDSFRRKSRSELESSGRVKCNEGKAMKFVSSNEGKSFAGRPYSFHKPNALEHSDEVADEIKKKGGRNYISTSPNNNSLIINVENKTKTTIINTNLKKSLAINSINNESNVKSSHKHQISNNSQNNQSTSQQIIFSKISPRSELHTIDTKKDILRGGGDRIGNYPSNFNIINNPSLPFLDDYSTVQSYRDSLDTTEDLDFVEEQCYDILVMGDDGVGKTTLLQQFMTSEFMGTSDLVFGSECEKRISVKLDGEETSLCFLDLPSALQKNCIEYREIEAYVICYSITDRQSFQFALDLLREFRERERRDVAIILVANKTDLVRSRKVLFEEGRAACQKYECKFIEVSASFSHCVDDLLAGLVHQIRLNPDRINMQRQQASYNSQRSAHPNRNRQMTRVSLTSSSNNSEVTTITNNNNNNNDYFSSNNNNKNNTNNSKYSEIVSTDGRKNKSNSISSNHTILSSLLLPCYRKQSSATMAGNRELLLVKEGVGCFEGAKAFFTDFVLSLRGNKSRSCDNLWVL